MFLSGNDAFLDGADPAPEAFALDGLDRFEARRRVVAWFEAEGLLDGVDPYPHQVPHGDRSKVPVEPWLTDQWFVDAEKLAGPAMAAVRDGRTTFHPENWAKTYFQWLENIEPWCVSRQLWWGHRIPVWFGPRLKDGLPGLHEREERDGVGIDLKTFCALTEEEALAQAKEYYGSDWRILVNRDDEKRIGFSLHEQPMNRTITITRDPDVLDTWFSSALWPFSTLGWPDETPELARYYPGAVLSTGFDIIFFWVARMMMMGLHFREEVPFRDVYMHALVRDEHGRKMSKSLGNIIDPLTLIDQYGADAVRMTLTAMAAMGRDLKLDVSRVEGYRNFATKLWNAARFCEMNGCAPDPGFDPATCKEPVNRWIVGETARLQAALDAALDAYRFNDAANALYAHVWGVYCDWWLEFAKPLLQGEDGPAKEETRRAAAWALERILILMHPVMPFVTEALWEQTAPADAPRDAPLALSDWPALDAAALADPDADADMGWTIAVIEAVRSARAEMNVNPGAQIPVVVVDATEATRERLERVRPLVSRLARLSDIAYGDAAPGGAVTVAVEGATLCLPLAGVIDVAAERERLAKALTKADKELSGLDRKLSNEAFLAKAPEAVVAEQRARREALAEQCAKFQAALVRLKELD
jgi:valyl-tRNA synthetase